MKNKKCQKRGRTNIDVKSVKKDLDVLNDENRLRILSLLKKHKELCVCEIFNELDLSQNLVSYHLGKLKIAGFVESKRIGVKIIYFQGSKKLKDFELVIRGLIK